MELCTYDLTTEGCAMTANEGTKREKQRRSLPVPMIMRLSDCGVRFLLSAVLAGAELMGGHSLFALALVGVCQPGMEGFAALLGAALGYLSFRGVVEGLRYIAASMMVCAVALAMGEFEIYHRPWFMPTVAAALNGMVGFVYQSAAGWGRGSAVGFITEVVLTYGTVYLYRQAFDLWEKRRPGGDISVRQMAGGAALAATLMMTLTRVTVAGDYSLGRVLCVPIVLIAAWKGGVGLGAAAGVAAGLAMGFSAGLPTYYTLVYALPGLIAGIFVKQSRLMCAAGYALSGAAAILWTWELGPGSAAAWELAAGTAVFLLLPDKLLRRLSALVRQEEPEEESVHARKFAADRLKQTAEAFRAVSGGLRTAFQAPAAPNDGDAARIFDRAADRVCVKCKQKERCWQREYQVTKTALADALTPMLDRGAGALEDFPPHFSSRCIRFETFLVAANGELSALLCRRRYDSRVRESRAAVCAQYGHMASVLDRAAVELAQEPAVDVRRQRLVKQRLAALGLEGRCTVYADQYGHLQLEVEGAGAEQLSREGEIGRLSAILGCPLRDADSCRGYARLTQKEPLMAIAGVAGADRQGQSVSGDAGVWFKDDSGKLNFLLCDGMGSGPAAREDSETALRLMEKFLRAGLEPEEALTTVGEALALRGEEEGGFTTVDLLQIDLFSGTSAVYKLGAAPTYLRRGGSVERLCGESLPAGVAAGAMAGPDAFPLSLDAGDCVLLVSDGVTTGKDDRWVRGLLADFDGLSPQALAAQVLRESGERSGSGDDRTVIAIKLDVRT
ncbi:MAG: SpoIIE family protein phosphatase [Clostridiales bacterium]|nr:SpoIIE family protein phosphatase [Clostridiales bacterium]